MIKTGHLGRLELLSLCVLASVADAALIYPQQLVLFGLSAGWMIPLVSMLICLATWAVIGPMLVKAGPKGDLISLSKRYLGPLQLPVLLIIALYLLIDVTALTRGFAEAVITTVLPRSPISFISIPFLLAVLYYAYQGVEGLSRVSWLVMPGTLLSFLGLLLLNANWFSYEYLFPLWGSGPVKIGIGGVLFTSVFLHLLILMVLGTRLRDRRDMVKIGYWSIVLTALMYALITFVFILAFSPDGAMRSPFPMYQLGRLIYIGRFFQRLEALFVFVWVTLALIKTSVSLWMICYLTASAFRMPVYRPLVFPIGLIIYALMFYPPGFAELIEWNNKYILTWGWVIVILLPVLLTYYFRMRQRKEEQRDESTAKTA
ncbi:hypothetical protein CBW65_16325 [Tumebacillus avium]|uniref:Uncharacterized protein n=1 Tax=Tumebacillus avium TaxID=1903704 RepID=A0A1Y0ISK3_9BACL|nr:endospore germination permease [Tumebacillus avium]ARU62353.1 hypothetical protein CBW65_16325 [Tumebacillus avium]